MLGLSGTGKTTLSHDPNRTFIGDDETLWTHTGIANIEGGSYAKCHRLNYEDEPLVYQAVKFGAVLENVRFTDPHRRIVDFNDTSITQNTRVSYPLEYLPNAKIPAVAGHPKNIVFLTSDANGVMPPVSKLNHEQAIYHFLSGYTATMAGVLSGNENTTATFSSCFGEIFLSRHPWTYAELLSKKIAKHKPNVWLVNTGWINGKFGVGQRIPMKFSRAIIDAINSGELEKAEFENYPIFNFKIPKESQVFLPKSLIQVAHGRTRLVSRPQLTSSQRSSTRISKSTQERCQRSSSLADRVSMQDQLAPPDK